MKRKKMKKLALKRFASPQARDWENKIRMVLKLGGRKNLYVAKQMRKGRHY